MQFELVKSLKYVHDEGWMKYKIKERQSDREYIDREAEIAYLTASCRVHSVNNNKNDEQLMNPNCWNFLFNLIAIAMFLLHFAIFFLLSISYDTIQGRGMWMWCWWWGRQGKWERDEEKKMNVAIRIFWHSRTSLKEGCP